MDTYGGGYRFGCSRLLEPQLEPIVPGVVRGGGHCGGRVRGRGVQVGGLSLVVAEKLSHPIEGGVGQELWKENVLTFCVLWPTECRGRLLINRADLHQGASHHCQRRTSRPETVAP